MFLESLLSKDLLEKEDGWVKLPIKCLTVEYPLASRFVKYAVESLGVYADIEEKHIQMIINLVGKENGKQLNLTNSISAIKEYDFIVLQLKSNKKAQMNHNFDFGVFEFGTNGEVLVDKVKNINDICFNNKKLYIDIDKLPKGSVLRFAKAGDVFKKFGSGVKKLSDYFADKKVPKRERDSIIVLANQNRIYCVVNMEISEEVKIDSSTVKLCASMILKSADILSPDSRKTKSPGTNSAESIIVSTPSRKTLFFTVTSLDKASAVLFALFS